MEAHEAPRKGELAMSTRLNTTVCLTALITTMGFVQAGNAAGDDGGDGDDGLRIALLQAGGSGTVSYDVTELKDGSRVNALTVTDGCMMMMGLEASDDLQVIGLEIGGDASISLHALGTDSSEDDFYEAGTHTVTLAAGGTQLVGAPNDGTISILWSDPPPGRAHKLGKRYLRRSRRFHDPRRLGELPPLAGSGLAVVPRTRPARSRIVGADPGDRRGHRGLDGLGG
ncbi:MAG: hypothetical protein CMJ33_07685 [Phycisphaerae bacterium]|nr:hypothetical protein [Phycisphaerae bacterium]